MICSFTRNTSCVIFTEITGTTNPDPAVHHAFPYIKKLLLSQRASSLRQCVNVDGRGMGGEVGKGNIITS